MDTFKLSNKDSLTINAHNNSLLFNLSKIDSNFKKILIIVRDYNNTEYFRKELEIKNLSAQLKIEGVPIGTYELNIYVFNEEQNLFWSYLCNHEIVINIDMSYNVSFITPRTLLKNTMVIGDVSRKEKSFIDSCLEATPYIQKDDPQIVSLAKHITAGKLIPYLKVLAIHDWVASNIYYDVDAYKSGKYTELDPSALGVLASRKSVCQGYSNLSIALLRSIGIPAYAQYCFALGMSSKGNWANKNNMEASANHQITLAFTNNQWLIMDETWDSTNKYEKGQYIKGDRVLHKYFDTTIKFISATHRFTL